MSTTRYIAKCKACKCVTSTLATNVNRANAVMGALFIDEAGESGTRYNFAIRCRKCGKARRAEPVKGRYSAAHLCDERCLSSTGFKCECSCGGKNHGGAHAA